MAKQYTFRLYDEELEREFDEWINTFPGESFNQKMKSFVKMQVHNPSKQEWLKATKEYSELETKEEQIKNPNRCNYRSLREDGKIDCSRFWLKKSQIKTVTQQFCDDCWSRLQWSRQKSGIDKTASRTFFCGLVNTTFKTELELPCRKDTYLLDKRYQPTCPNTKCEFYH